MMPRHRTAHKRLGTVLVIAAGFLSALILAGCAHGASPALVTAVETHPAPVNLQAGLSGEGYDERRDAMIAKHALDGRGTDGVLCRLAAGQSIDAADLTHDLEKLANHEETSDFRLASIIRLIYQFGHDSSLTPEARDNIRKALLVYKYWPDEPGDDDMCTWTENHQILLAGGAYLAGQLYPDEMFANSGKTGRDLMAIHRSRVVRWLDLRFQTGFSEWLSNIYYKIDAAGLANLADFAEDPEISTKAAMVLDLLLMDMALNSQHGIFGSTHGRSYQQHKKSTARGGTAPMRWLLFGTGPEKSLDTGAIALALSTKYRMPRVLYKIANDSQREAMVNRQRMGICVEDGPRWGLGYDNAEDGMVWLAMEAYSHPLTIDLFVNMLDDFNWWGNQFYTRFEDDRAFITEARKVEGRLQKWAEEYEHDFCRKTRQEVNIYTYRTPDYMLSTAQDYMKAYGGDQQSIWQATLGEDTACFTTHPAQLEDSPSPGYWTGYGYLPRAGQVKNVVITIHDATEQPARHVPETLDFTHAWLPRSNYDEIIEAEGWVFARKGDGYLALRSQNPYHWQPNEGEDKDGELIVPGRKNIYICEMGRRATDGGFAAFVERIKNAPLEFDGLSVKYESPSQGLITFGWDEPLICAGEVIGLDNYPRYANPYVNTPSGEIEFPPTSVAVEFEGCSLHHDWARVRREVVSVK